MITCYLLSKKETNKLFKLLDKEYIKEEFNIVTNYICRIIFNNYDVREELTLRASIKLIFTIAKILLDNLYLKIINNEVNELIRLIAHKTFCMNIYIKSFYIHGLYVDIVGPCIPEDYQYYIIESELGKGIANYINYIYINSSDEFNEAFMNLIAEFQETMSWYHNSNYRIEIMEDKSPILISIS